MQAVIKKKVLRRLRILEGQVRGVQRMVEQEKYCIDILNQSAAIRQAVTAIDTLILENHLETHVREQMRGSHGERAVHELIKVYKKLSA